jgi:chromosome segregation ATPase
MGAFAYEIRTATGVLVGYCDPGSAQGYADEGLKIAPVAAIPSADGEISDADRTAATIAAYEREIAGLRTQLDREERDQEKILAARDAFHDALTEAAEAAGCEHEWSNLHAHGPQCISDAIDAAIAEKDAEISAARRDRDAAHTACAEAQSEVARLRQTIHEQADLIGRMNQALEQMRIEAAQIALQRDQWRRLHDASEAHRLDVTREVEALRIVEQHTRALVGPVESFVDMRRWAPIEKALVAVDTARTPPPEEGT